MRASSIQRRGYSRAAATSGSEAVNFCLDPFGVWTVMIASPPDHSICPRHRRSSLFCLIRSRSVAMSWNFRLELPELSTRTFICVNNRPCSREHGEFTSARELPGRTKVQLGGLARLLRPFPVGNIGPVRAVFESVVPAGDLLVAKLLQSGAADSLQPRNVLYYFHGQSEAIDSVLDRQFQRSIDVAFLLITVDVQV